MIKTEYQTGNWDKLGRGEKCRRLALITAKSLSRQDLRLARRNEFEGGGRLFLQFISRHLDLGEGKPLEQRDMFQRWLQKYVVIRERRVRCSLTIIYITRKITNFQNTGTTVVKSFDLV